MTELNSQIARLDEKVTNLLSLSHESKQERAEMHKLLSDVATKHQRLHEEIYGNAERQEVGVKRQVVWLKRAVWALAGLVGGGGGTVGATAALNPEAAQKVVEAVQMVVK